MNSACDDLKPLAQVPALDEGPPAPGKRVRETDPEYSGTGVHHSLYLPVNFGERSRHPLIVEFTGNHAPWAGSTGRVDGAHLGYSLTLGRDFIWVVLPFIASDHQQNEITWWGDEAGTVAYAKKCIPGILQKYQGDPGAVILCGFSRGAIATSYIGLHDDEIAGLWSAFLTSDHFDGVREWAGTEWGSPLQKYRVEAAVRLRRLQGRPCRVCQDESTSDVESFLSDAGLLSCGKYTFQALPLRQLFPAIPNRYFPHAHTDLWPLFDTPASREAREWVASQGGIK